MISHKPKVFLWTDCYFFGGCENLVVTLLLSPAFREHWEVCARYRFSNAYRRAAEIKGVAPTHLRPIWLPTLETWISRVREMDTAAASLRRIGVLLCHFALRVTGFEAAYAFMRLAVEIARCRPAAVLINNGGYPGALSCRMAAVAAWAFRVPVVFVVNNVAQPSNGRIEALLDFLVCASVSCFVTASGFTAAALRKRLQLRESAVACIANCLPQDRYLRINGDRSPASVGADSRVRVVGVAHLERRKGFHVLVQAIDLLHAKPTLRNGFRVDIVGDGPERPALERQVSKLGLGDVIRFTGPRDDFPAFLDDADIFCLPSIAAEDMPYALIEAMFVGKPIVSTEVSGIPELLGNGRYGMVVPPDDAVALARAIQALIEGADVRRALGDEARRRAVESHSPAAFVRSYTAILGAVLSHETERAYEVSGDTLSTIGVDSPKE